MKKENVIFERKEFLNLPGHNGMANVIARIITFDSKSDKVNDEGKPLYRNNSYTLDFADCSRVISMAIDDYDEYERENAIYKVDTLIEVLTEFREVLGKEMKYQHRLEKRRKRHEASKKKED